MIQIFNQENSIEVHIFLMNLTMRLILTIQ